MRNDGLFRVRSELVSTEYSTTPQAPTTSLPSTSQHLPPQTTTCASFLINRLLNDREDGNQQPPFSPEFELDQWADDDETEITDDDDDDDDVVDDDDDDDDNDDDDITDYVDLCSKRANQVLDIL